MNNKPYYVPADHVPIPPKNADVLTTACDYCIVACGYKVFRWPVGAKEGGVKASQNAVGRDLPIKNEKGGWISPNMFNVVSHNGKPHNVIVMPDPDADVVNLGGDHSIRGGCIAQKCYNPNTPTKDRLQFPQLRVKGKLERISWDDAVEIFAEVGKHVIKKHGVHAFAQKQFSYNYFENSYALTKFALAHVRTPAFAFHDNPTDAPSTPGWRDIGIRNFGAAYQDWYDADTLMICGTDPFETKTVLFNEWILRATAEHRQRQIYVNPRKTTGPAFAEKMGGLHLWLIPGTDALLYMALARNIIENGWEDRAWIDEYTSNKWESDSGFGQGTRNTPWQWRTTWGKFQVEGYEDYKKWLLSQKHSELGYAAEVCGLDPDDIEEAAEMLAKPKADGSRVKTSIGIEKGCYWSNNYLNTASVGSLALVCGTGNRPGQMIGRFGGHQRGGLKGGRYPLERSPEKFVGRRRKPLDLDRWVSNGNVRFAYVIGCTWTAGMTGSNQLEEIFRRDVLENPHQITSTDKAHVIDTFKKRVDSGGMVMTHQEIYLRRPLGTEIADLVLPASGWGENDLTRANGERRIRLYSKFYDAPGEAKPDWWIVAQIAKKMGFDGFNWKDSNDVFEESARFGRNGPLNFHPLVWKAKRDGKKGHELLREYGTTGIQGPILYEDGKLVGTVRLHDSTRKLPATGPEGPTVWPKWLTSFNTQSGKANFIKSPWMLFDDFYEFLKPKDGEIWVINGRINEIWQSGFDDVQRRPYITQRFPENFLEINPEDAKRLGIESGDYVEASSDRIPVQTGGFLARDLEDALFSGLQKNGHIDLVSAKVRAVAMVMPVPRPGVAFMYFLNTKDVANRLVPRVADPISNNYRFKLSVAKLKKLGESPYKHDPSMMTFAPRGIV